MEKTESPETAVLALHEKFMGADQARASLRPVNQAGIDRFAVLKFPHKKHEMYTFVNTHELAHTSFELVADSPVDTAWVQNKIYPACKNSVMVFVNGAYQENLSDLSGLGDSFKIQCLSEAVTDDEIKQALLDCAENENDVFAAINSAFVHHGVWIDIPAKATFASPVQFLYISTGSASASAPVTSHPRLIVRLGETAELKAVVTYAGTRENYFVNAVNDLDRKSVV